MADLPLVFIRDTKYGYEVCTSTNGTQVNCVLDELSKIAAHAVAPAIGLALVSRFEAKIDAAIRAASESNSLDGLSEEIDRLNGHINRLVMPVPVR